MALRGHYGMAAVGNPVYHDVGDRAEAVRRMDAWLSSFVTELGQQLAITLPDGKRTTLPDLAEIRPEVLDPAAATAMRNALAHDPKMATRWSWYLVVMKPALSAWHAFRRDQIGGDSTVTPDYLDFAKRWETDWDVYEHWNETWAHIYDNASKVFSIKATPMLPSLPTTIINDITHFTGDGLHKIGDKLGEGWTLAKVAVIGGIALGGVIALASVVNSVRTKSDPMAPYLRFAKR